MSPVADTGLIETMQVLLFQYSGEIQKLYGPHLKSIILYGSYARGDYTENSDIDIMILVDLPDEELECYFDALSELGFQYNVEYGIWIMPIVKNIEHFRRWVCAYPFYRNVQNEGVALYETTCRYFSKRIWQKDCGGRGNSTRKRL